jgi:hypothetical protein
VSVFTYVTPHPDVDNVLQRMTIVGVILSFRQLAQGALVDVLEERIPFLLSSILDFRHHLPSGDPMVSYSFGSIIESKSLLGGKVSIDSLGFHHSQQII